MIQNLPVILIGINSILLQVVCIRQLLSAFSGNELIIGITLAAWLILVSFGSYIGTKVRFKYAFGLSFILTAFIVQPTLFLIEVIRPILGYGIGEVIPLPSAAGCIVLSLSLLCLVIGAQFPLAVSYLHKKAPEAYSFEALGAFIGGVIFTFLFAGRLDAYQVVLLAAVINIFVSIFILRKAILLPLLILPFLIHYAGGQAFNSLQYEGFELVSKAESRYGGITVLKLKDQFNLYSSDKFQFSYPDAQTEELNAHIPMSLDPDAQDLLIVGGSPAVIREFLKYPVRNIDFAEIDPVMIDVSKGLLSAHDSAVLEDQRIHMMHVDARRFIKVSGEKRYDLILLNIPEPATANLNRFYTVEFFREAKAVMKREGQLYLSLPASFGYISNKMQLANGSVYRSLKEVFPYVEASSEEYGIIIASMSPVNIDPDILIRRFESANIRTENFRQYILQDAFSPLQVEMVKARLGKVTEINTDRRPVSYLYNIMLWAEIHNGRWLNLFLKMGEKRISILVSMVIGSLSLIFIVRRQPVSYAIFTTGYFTMAFSVIIMLTFQSFFGYIYERIGMLSGTFMLGGAAGAYVMRRIGRPESWLKAYDLFALILLMSSIFLLKNEAVFYMMLFTAGFIGGGQFAAASRTGFGSAEEGFAGRLYALDLAGSFLGALLTAIFLIPLIGMQKTVFSLIFMKMISLIYLSAYKKA